MAIHEIRETISGSSESTNGQIIVQRKINLEPGKRHTISHLDWFDDAISGGSAANAQYKMEVFLTNYPLVLTNRAFHTGSGLGGPNAGDDQVLFKAHRINFPTGRLGWYDNEFPNQFLGATPTFSFYTPTLYWTIVWTQEEEVNYSRNFEQSLYLALESEDVDAVEYGIGLLREHSANQARLLTNNGIAMTQAEVIGGMPMWEIGGIRPEIMTGYDPILVNTGWYLDQSYGDNGEGMQGGSSIRATLDFARTMVDHTSAFGATGGIEAPDWFKAIAKPFPGLTSGPERSQFPPVLKLNNGNTEMV